MKKLLAISAIALLAGCACFECEEDYIEETTPVAAPANVYRGLDDRGCNYLTDEDCKRDHRSYVQSQNYQQQTDLYIADYPQPQNNIAYREEINIQETQSAAPVPVTVTTPSAADLAACEALQATSSESTLPDGSPCPAKIRETREPVEIVYKKTTYKTVYEPKTTSSVTYEKEPYKPGVEIKTTGDVETTVTKTTTTTSTTTTEDVLPTEEIK